jgi:hypothetical protein
MSTEQERRRRIVELVLIVIVALIGWYIARPHPATGPAVLLHWASAAIAAYLLGAAAWTVIRTPSRILLSLGYLLLGVAMTLSFIGDFAQSDYAQRIQWYSLAALYAGLVLSWLDYRKSGGTQL